MSIVRADIENLLALYAWAFDMDEIDKLGDMFVEDAEVEFSNGRASGRTAIVEDLERRRQVFRDSDIVPWHIASNIVIHASEGETAQVTSFFTFYIRRPTGELEINSIGYYDDTFVQDGPNVRISRRRVVSGGRRESQPYVSNL